MLCFGLYLIEQSGSFWEEGIVEIDDCLVAAEVDVERLGLDVEALQFLFVLDAVEYFPVAVSPSIDALLYVTDEHTFASRSQFLEEKLLEVLPLHATCVLELVDHDIIYICANLFEDERGIASLNHFAEEGGCGT